MVDDQARNALREAIANAFFQHTRNDVEAADAVMAVLPVHAPAVLTMLGNVREGRMIVRPSGTSADLTFYGPSDRFGVPVAVVTLRPAGEDAS